MIKMEWDSNTKEKFQLMVSRIPLFHRRIAETSVNKKAEENARLRNSDKIEEQDVIGAFFGDVPSPFYGMMVRLMDQTGFDYRKYGFPK